MELTRRHFTSLLGLATLGGIAGVAKVAASEHAARTTQTAAVAHTAGATVPGALTTEQIWANLLEGNKRFVAGKAQARELVHTRQELAKGQHPKVIVLGCADSRVSPELVFDKNLGELFVVRTAGNIADPIALGSIEYAVEHLHATLLVVLGHEKCGAVAAAAAGGKMPTPNLEAIVQKITPALKPLQKSGVSGDLLASLGVEANVRQSAQDLRQNSPIIRHEIETGKLALIPAVYQLESGAVMRVG